MRFIDRFTKDEVSAKVWWPFALLLIVLVVGSFFAERRAVQQRYEDATQHAVAYVDGVLAAAIGSTDAPLVGSAAQDARQAVSGAVDADPDVRVIRAWSSDGTLLFSTDPRDPIGSNQALNDGSLGEAATTPGTAVVVSSEFGMNAQPVPTAFHVYTTMPSQSAVIGEVEMPDAPLLADVHSQWLMIRLILALGALLILALALLSMRKPVAQIGGGVPFHEETIPPGFALVTADERAELSQAGVHARERVRSVETRLRELERDKLRLEGELQRALSSNASGIRTSATPGAAAEPPVRAPARRSEPAVVVPEPMPSEPTVVPEPMPPEPVVAPRASEPVLAPKPEPSPPPEPAEEPAATTTAPAPAATTAPAPAAEEPKVVAIPEPAAAIEDVVVLPETEPEPAPATPVPATVVPATAGATGAASSVDDHDAVLDVLNRLVEPVETPPAATDPSVIRAKLARTAALKKPGSRERREERERDQS